MTTPDPAALFSELNAAVAASGLDQYVFADAPPTAVFGPGDEIQIVYDVRPEQLPDWERLSFSPTEDQPPRWSARIFSVAEDEEISSHDDPNESGPSHDSADAAAQALADNLAEYLSP